MENIDEYLCKKAKLQARIKPTALCSVIDKENSIVPIRFATLCIQLLLWLCTLSPTVLISISWLLCYIQWLWHDHSVISITPLWLCDYHVMFPMLHLSNNLKEKKYKYWLSCFTKSWQSTTIYTYVP